MVPCSNGMVVVKMEVKSFSLLVSSQLHYLDFWRFFLNVHT